MTTYFRVGCGVVEWRWRVMPWPPRSVAELSSLTGSDLGPTFVMIDGSHWVRPRGSARRASRRETACFWLNVGAPTGTDCLHVQRLSNAL